jgi:hypothetical protein
MSGCDRMQTTTQSIKGCESCQLMGQGITNFGLLRQRIEAQRRSCDRRTTDSGGERPSVRRICRNTQLQGLCAGYRTARTTEEQFARGSGAWHSTRGSPPETLGTSDRLRTRREDTRTRTPCSTDFLSPRGPPAHHCRRSTRTQDSRSRSYSANGNHTHGNCLAASQTTTWRRPRSERCEPGRLTLPLVKARLSLLNVTLSTSEPSPLTARRFGRSRHVICERLGRHYDGPTIRTVPLPRQ